MSWSYSGDPSASNLDEVRFLIGDTDSADALVQDEEINYAIATEANNRMAAVRIARALSSKLSRKVDKDVGDLKIKYSQMAKQFSDLAVFLEKEAVSFGAIPYAGGIGESDKESVEDNTDRVSPSIKRAIHDNPGTTYPDSQDLCD
jgi:hypothetical protein